MENQANQPEAVNRRLRAAVGDSMFEAYLKMIRFGGYKDGTVILLLPTNFFCSYVSRNFSKQIEQAWKEEDPSVSAVKFEVGMLAASAAPAEAERSAVETHVDIPMPEEKVQQISAALDPRYTFDNFIVGAPNEFAYAAARKVAESPVICFNPLYLYSGAGLGKTHLMHSIAWYIRDRQPNRKVVYLSAERFMRQFVGALRHKDTYAFKEQFGDVDVLLIDDVQFLIGKDATQIEFFHVFNDLIGRGKQIVLSADKPPVNLDGIEDRLKTRLGSGIVADIHPTTYELRLGILASKADNLGVAFPQEVLEFLAEKITSSVRELEGALLRVAAHVQLMGGEVTLERARDILRDILNVFERSITIDEIQQKVAEHYNVRTSELMSKRRERSIARPRQVAMYLAKALTTKSLPDIGRAFDRDHTTVIHAVKTIEDLREKDAAFRDETDGLRRALSF